MDINTGDCYTPWEEYIGVIPVEALTGAQVDFYVEYEDITDSSTLTFRKHDDPEVVYNAENPAFFLLSNATTVEFTLHVTGDFHCVTPDGSGPGIAGGFNGWTYDAMTSIGNGLYTFDIVVAAGSDPSVYFKFKNGVDGWESLPGGPLANREYIITQGDTEDDYFGYWNDEEECECTEVPLNVDQQIVFNLDMNHQDAASYAGGVSIMGDTAPLTWNIGTELLDDTDGDGIYTVSLDFLTGVLNTLEYKFGRSADGTNWEWESVGNRLECLDPDNGFLVLNDLWDNYEPPTVTTVDIDVTFQVDMNCLDAALYAGGVSVQGGAAPLNWTSGSTLLSDPDMNGIFDVTVTFPAGTPLEFGHKFNFSTDGTNWNWEDNVSDRMIYLDDAEPVVVLDPVKWDNWMCGMAVSIAPMGANVEISWDAVGPGYTYHVYSSDEAYSETYNLLETTTATSVTVPASEMGFYYVTYEMVAE